MSYVVAAYAYDSAEAAFKVGVFLILPLACIWFADAMGGHTGPTTSIPITAPTPGIIVLILGWLLLLLPVAIGVGYALVHVKT